MVKPAFPSPFFSTSPPLRGLLVARKRRSQGELVRRRQRHLSYQLSQPSGDWTSSWFTPSPHLPNTFTLPAYDLPLPSYTLPSSAHAKTLAYTFTLPVHTIPWPLSPLAMAVKQHGTTIPCLL
eukprot:TRINITY_DN13384_c0_g1_i1.p1 TRINITY_DN13384_c0_g1~~TRINITY_DN13384_c0_g1_i1.p1  ORF type:complete len:123 (-),score=25.10 TRINITY_DN13384_c0_g1_i1:210-578(-)